jgi:hypothetical protein
MDALGSISRIRREDLDDRDVSARDLRASVLTAPYVAYAVIARRLSGAHVRPSTISDVRQLFAMQPKWSRGYQT